MAPVIEPDVEDTRTQKVLVVLGIVVLAFNLRPAAVSQLHAELVFLLVGLTVGVLVAFSVTTAPERALRAVRWLLGIELAQGLVGFVQYFTDLPIVLVGLHVLGAALVSACATWVLLGTRDRGSRRPHLDVATTN